jgi:hypothetical protein
MTAFNNEISSADKIGLHLSEVGRIQNNAGSLLQFMAILFAISIYFFNALVFPASTHRLIFGGVLALYAVFMFTTCYLYLRCLTFSVGWIKLHPSARHSAHFLSTLSEQEIEKALFRTVRSFRRGTYCFFLCFFTALVLVSLLAFGSLQKG